jgi:hypothetical protein
LNRNKKNRLKLALATILSALIITCASYAAEPKITVYNPLGQPPAIKKVPMAPRITNLDGKTIYIVDIGFSATHQLLTELQDILKVKYPKTKWELRTKIGTYFNDDPELWKEIKEKGHAMIMGVGH